MIEWLKKILFKKELEELNRLADALEEKEMLAERVYTTIRSYQGFDPDYYNWVVNLLHSNEYQYFMFDIREAVLRKMAGIKDKEETMRLIGQLDMINTIDSYLKRYKVEYENEIRRNRSE